jgi:hypothetical protein
VAVTPDGRFDGSPDGMRLMHYVQDGHILPLEAFFEKFYTPKLLEQVLAGNLPAAPAEGVDFAKAVKLPPKVEILSPKGPAAESEEAEVEVSAEDQGGGIDEIRLYLNGKLVSEDARGMKIKPERSRQRQTYRVSLSAGNNELRATAFNKDRTESSPALVQIEFKGAQASANLHVIAVGINVYKNSIYNLNYGRPDAQALVNALKDGARPLFKEIKIVELYDSDATLANVVSAFEQAAVASKPQDVFVFYYAGHGVMEEGERGAAGEFFLVPHDVTQLYGDSDSLSQKALSAARLKALLSKIPAQKQLVLLDACQSGGAVEAFALRGAPEQKALYQLARSAGVVVIAASGTQQFASEVKELGHGVFTDALLEGLSGKAAGGAAAAGKVTVKQLEAYLNDRVPELTQRYRGSAQYPVSYSSGMDFPITFKGD